MLNVLPRFIDVYPKFIDPTGDSVLFGDHIPGDVLIFWKHVDVMM